MDNKKRQQNEKIFGHWEDLPDGSRRYWYDVENTRGWKARYVKEVEATEKEEERKLGRAEERRGTEGRAEVRKSGERRGKGEGEGEEGKKGWEAGKRGGDGKGGN
ncbi:MAG: hypothetical protein HY730_00480 [Candidatus Tectomicrobia bacterium]|uniref:Uncharacterized protein n=1 Tax=Tectimicrobiota bacterium TaxID=2528274 RepID=A0A933GJR2_UNCTE|nr:hypothetical protein [Candidatus Tectomicrobia bacterium]